MHEIDFMSSLHKETKRDYLSRVNDKEYPKHIAANLAKKWDFDYWDGDRRINYGGYNYIEGRWEKVAKAILKHRDMTNHQNAALKIDKIFCNFIIFIINFFYFNRF